MAVLATNYKQLIYIYSEDSSLGKRVLPYAKALVKDLRTININDEAIADTVWSEIAALLDCPLGDLFDSTQLSQSGQDAQDTYSAVDWLKIINKNPSVLQQPIVINGTKAKRIYEKHQIFSFFNPTGANFDKSPEAIKSANHKDTTGNK